MKEERRDFLKKSAIGAAGLVMGAPTIINAMGKGKGPNDTITMAVAGVNSRGRDVAIGFSRIPGCEIAYVIDVDSKARERAIEAIGKNQKHKPKGYNDYREVIQKKGLDAIIIATPEHWQTPMALDAVKAGLHVYIEKPGSHNPHEVKLLVAAQKKYNKVIHLGNQRRSHPVYIKAVEEIKAGIIGDVYLGKNWYTNRRPSIGFGKPAQVPAHLDFELWQGPAPRQSYVDNLIHYNWHWRWKYGTGETGNNMLHEVDVARWAMDVDAPIKVHNSGGRYHHKDDWETPDTQIVTFDCPGGKTIMWEGRSCNHATTETAGGGRGTSWYGKDGFASMVGTTFKAFDNNKKLIKEFSIGSIKADMTNTVGMGAGFDDHHKHNFLAAVRGEGKSSSSIDITQGSPMMAHLANISWKLGRSIDVDPKTSKILNDREAMKLWSREYEPGWEPENLL